MHEPVVVPPLGEGIVEVVVDRWHVAVGVHVAAGQALVELETDKASFEVRALAPGRVVARRVEEGAVVRAGDTLATFEVDAHAGLGAPPTAMESTAKPTSPAADAHHWEVCTVPLVGGAGPVALEAGWEPFALADARTLVLRRRI